VEGFARAIRLLLGSVVPMVFCLRVNVFTLEKHLARGIFSLVTPMRLTPATGGPG
jgi:hypothetical protein